MTCREIGRTAIQEKTKTKTTNKNPMRSSQTHRIIITSDSTLFGKSHWGPIAMSSYQLTPGSRLSSWPAYAEQANHTWLVRLQDNLWEAPPGGAPGTIPENKIRLGMAIGIG
ncbi:hypothetical protein IAQ61_010133, partial [Plenodomus lingam]|uniref:Predicted protein n=1 Tax=Leptosphaeria maculans (strain JN3 / isolate v23.1.3 / race Av1-4-5-6-7-8) TaxID=985895 RepID=E5A316_LEPMJ